MKQPDPKLVDDIYRGALERPAAGRLAYVDERCGDDDTLRQRVAELVAAADASPGELEERIGGIRDRLLQSVLGDGEAERDAGEDLCGQRIDAWRLGKRLARGGLATVYLAHRADGTYEQRAAFKILRRGLDTDDLVARFRAERQILSSLEHPAIAQILDGGALEDGRPYLVLEYVDGVPITEYCRAHGVSVRGRIRLLLDVLGALHHAHRNLVVHRDVKPSNILVSAEGHVSLLDFGIAKLLDPASMPGASTLTRTGMSLLTPGYCSPEQHAGEPVTTASDVYQAGAVLHELLTGRRPRGVADGGHDIARSMPSEGLKGSPDLQEVRGDLDAIVGKAMHADPSQRYAAASEMAADLKRYLDGRPIIARPDTLRYRFVKFSKRRPWALPVAAVAVCAVVGYLVTLTVYTEQLRIEQRRAAAAQAFMVNLLQSPDPFRPADPERGSDITVVEALDLGVERLKTDLQNDPKLRASLLSSIAGVYASLDQHDEAIALRAEALPLERRIFGEPSEQVLQSLAMLAEQYRTTGNYERAAGYYEQQLEMARAMYPADHPAFGAALARMARMKSALGDYGEGRRLYELGIEKLRKAPREYPDQLINALVALGNYQRTPGERDAAMATLSAALDLANEVYGPDSLSAALVHAQIATSLSVFEEYERSETEFRKAIAIYDERLGREHGATLSTLNNLGVMYMNTGQYDQAEETMREVVRQYEQKYGTEHRVVAASYQNLATVFSRQRRYAEAIPLHRKAFEIYAAVADEHLAVHAFPLLSLAFAELGLGEFAAAEATARRALGMLDEAAAGAYPVGAAKCFVALAMEGQGRRDEARQMLDAAHRLLIGSTVRDPYRSACRLPEP